MVEMCRIKNLFTQPQFASVSFQVSIFYLMEERYDIRRFFYEVKGKFMGADVSDIHEHLAYQFNIEDEEAGGAFYVEVKDGVLYVEPYEYYDRDAMFISTPEIFRKIADGEMDPVWAFTTQKLRVEGNIDKALKLNDIIQRKKKELKKEAKEAKKAEKETKKGRERSRKRNA